MSENEVCLANIDSAGRRKRVIGGVAGLALAAVLHFMLVRDRGAGWLAVTFGLLFYGWLGIIQAAEKTCVVLAARGTQETGGATAPIDDKAIVAALRRRATGIYVKSALAALATGALLWYLGRR